MTPLEGLMMGTRAGSVDPGILLELLDGRLQLASSATRCSTRRACSASPGSAPTSARWRPPAAGGDARAALALELFVRRAAAVIGAAGDHPAAARRLVFTGGIGAHAAPVRAAICGRLAPLGVPAQPPRPGRATPC